MRALTLHAHITLRENNPRLQTVSAYGNVSVRIQRLDLYVLFTYSKVPKLPFDQCYKRYPT